MKKRTNAILWGIMVVFVFLIVVVMYYFVYQQFVERRSPATYTLTDSRPVVSEGMSFQEEVKRFLSVYDTQEFSSNQALYDFLVLELNRFSLYPVETVEEGEMKKIVLDNVKSILNKMEKKRSDISQETAALQELLDNIN